MKRIYVTSNKNYNSIRTAELLTNKLRKRNFTVLNSFDNSCDLIISVGGDGAFLKAIRRTGFSSCPIAGINTGHLGFYQDFLPNNIDRLISDIESKNLSARVIHPLECEVISGNKRYFQKAINEFVVRCQKNTTVHIKLFIDGVFIERFSGDGIIISSTSGSTAYNFSLGGAIVDPRLELLQITPLSPINSSAYRCISSSVVIPNNSVVTIVPESRFKNFALLQSDGQNYRYDSVNKFNFTYSKSDIKILSDKNYEFWRKIKEKFL